jgi:hypothetical protein
MKKKSTAEYAETAEIFLGKDKKHKLFFGYGLLLAFQSSGIEDKTKRKQRAQRSFLESPLAVLIFRDGWKRGPLSPLHPVPGHLAISTSAFSATSAVRFFMFFG